MSDGVGGAAGEEDGREVGKTRSDRGRGAR